MSTLAAPRGSRTVEVRDIHVVRSPSLPRHVKNLWEVLHKDASTHLQLGTKRQAVERGIQIGTSARVSLTRDVRRKLDKVNTCVIVREMSCFLVKFAHRRPTGDGHDLTAEIEGLESRLRELGPVSVAALPGTIESDAGFDIHINPLQFMSGALVVMPSRLTRQLAERARLWGLRYWPLSPLPIGTPVVAGGGEEMAAGPMVDREHRPRLGGSGPIVKIGVIDTGADILQPLLARRQVHFREFDENGRPVSSVAHDADRARHGTKILSKIIEICDGFGLAQRIELSVALALPIAGTGSPAQLIGALNWLVDEQQVDVLNCSLVTRDWRGKTKYRSLYRDIFISAIEQGVVLVAPTGNDGQGSVGAPAAFSGTVSVGATEPGGQFWKDSGHGYVREEGNVFHPRFIACGMIDGNAHVRTSFACPRATSIIAKALAESRDVKSALASESILLTIGQGKHLGTTSHLSRLP